MAHIDTLRGAWGTNGVIIIIRLKYILRNPIYKMAASMRMITPRGRRVRGAVGSTRWPPAGRRGRGEYRIKAGHLKTTIRNGTAATGAMDNTAHRRVENTESGRNKAPPRSDLLLEPWRFPKGCAING